MWIEPIAFEIRKTEPRHPIGSVRANREVIVVNRLLGVAQRFQRIASPKAKLSHFFAHVWQPGEKPSIGLDDPIELT